MANKKVSISVDYKFFKNQFEPKRKKAQEQLGILNLSQVNFTRMIEIKVKEPKIDLSQVNKKSKRRNNGKV